MGFRKYICTHGIPSSDTKFGNAIIIPDNYCHTLSAYRRLFHEAKKSFPNLKPDDVECRTVVRSSWCKSMPIITFAVPPNTEIEGWDNIERVDFDTA